MEQPEQLCLPEVSFRTVPVTVRNALRSQPGQAVVLFREGAVIDPGGEALFIPTQSAREAVTA